MGPSQVLSRGLWTPPPPPLDCPEFGPHGTPGRAGLLSPSTVPHRPPGRAPLTLQRSRESRPPPGDRFKARRLPLPPLQDPRSSAPPGMDASGPVSPTRAHPCPGRLAESGPLRLASPPPPPVTGYPSAGAVSQWSSARGHTRTPVGKHTQVHARPHTHVRSSALPAVVAT